MTFLAQEIGILVTKSIHVAIFYYPFTRLLNAEALQNKPITTVAIEPCSLLHSLVGLYIYSLYHFTVGHRGHGLERLGWLVAIIRVTLFGSRPHKLV